MRHEKQSRWFGPIVYKVVCTQCGAEAPGPWRSDSDEEEAVWNERVCMPQDAGGGRFPDVVYGKWQSDHDRTLAELKFNLRSAHPKIQEYGSPEMHCPLTQTKSPGWVVYDYRGEQVRAKHRIVGFDEFTVVTEVERTWISDQTLWHLHFLSGNCYWVTVDTDWGFSYREFFSKIGD